MALEQENETYNNELAVLLGNEGKFVLIKGDEVVGIFDTYEAALTAGYGRFGLDSFLVRQIQQIQQIQFISRFIDPCRT